MIIILPNHLNRPDKRAVLIVYLGKIIRQSVTHWEKYCDGKIPPEQQKFHHDRYQELTDEAEEIFKALKIGAEWSGLYPTLILPDGSFEHDIERAINWIANNKS